MKKQKKMFRNEKENKVIVEKGICYIIDCSNFYIYYLYIK